jgi:hypothetical protein
VGVVAVVYVVDSGGGYEIGDDRGLEETVT